MLWARRFGLTLGVFVAALTVPGAAAANGDPASDVLQYRDVLFVSGSGLPTTSDRIAQLTEVVKEAKRSGLRIKVALIGKPEDLGLVTQLWRRPQRYADFLGRELASFWNYHQRLLVVMPNGYGIYLKRSSSNSDKRVLAHLPVPASRPDLLNAASVAVVQLAAQDGIKLTLLPVAEPTEGSWNRYAIWIGAGALIVLAFAAILFAWRRRLQ